MRNFDDLLSANDRDIFDLLVASKKKISTQVLLRIARERRGIFYSPMDGREELADKISLLPHDSIDIENILNITASSKRRDKTTSIKLDKIISHEEIRMAVDDCRKTNEYSENISDRAQGFNNYSLDYLYFEYDYSRTRLLQKEQRKAEIKFITEPDGTTIRFPPTEKSHRLVSGVIERIQRNRKEPVREERIELTLLDKKGRTDFFTKLISSIQGHDLLDVMKINVAPSFERILDEEEPDLDNDFHKQKEKLMAIIKNMSISGQNILQSEEYQSLIDKGFFITNIRWKCRCTETNDIIEFNSGFDDEDLGKEFSYNVLGAYRFRGKKTIIRSKELLPMKMEYCIPL